MKNDAIPDGQSSSSAGESKYSLIEHRWVGDTDYKNELIGNPGKTLPDQCTWVMPNPRLHLIDHFIDNDTQAHIPLNSWKCDFIAGELALDNLDLEEAERMFQLSLKEAKKDKNEQSKLNITFSELRLAYIARKQGNTDKAEKLYLAALPQLKAAGEEGNHALDIVFQELALLAWQKHKYADAERFFKERVDLKIAMFGPLGAEQASAKNDLANVLFYQNKLPEADKLYKYCLLVSERFTDDINHSIQAASNLANCRFVLHKYADALALYKRFSASTPTANKIAECKKALSESGHDQQKTQDLPPEIGNAEVLSLLLETARFNLDHERTWETEKILKVAKREALANGQPELIAMTESVSADLAFAKTDYRGAIPLYLKTIEKLGSNKKPECQKIVTAAKARLLLCQLANNDAVGAEKSIAAISTYKDKQLWTDITGMIQNMLEQRNLRTDDKQTAATLQKLASLCVTNTPKGSFANALALSNLARAYQRSPEAEKCEQLFTESLATAAKANDKNEENVAQIQTAFAMHYMQNSQYRKAEPLLLDGLSYAEKNPGKEQRNLLASLQHLTSLYQAWQKPELEEEYYKRMINARPPSNKSFAEQQKISDLINLANMRNRRCDYDNAIASFDEVLSLQERSGGDSSSSLRDLASIYQRSGQYAKLSELQQKLAQRMTNPADRSRLQTLFAAGQAAFKSGNFAASSKLAETIITEMERQNETKDRFHGCYYDEPRYTSCLLLLANSILDGERNHDRAISLYDKALAASKSDTSTPGCRPVSDSALINAGPPPIDTEQLVCMLLCCDAIGNTQRGDELRKTLKERIEQSHSAQIRQKPALENPAYQKVIAAIDKKKRSAQDELELMELVPQSMHANGVYSGSQAPEAQLLERAIVLREKKSSNEDITRISADYAALTQIYMDNRSFDLLEPLSLRRLKWLKQHSADKKEICVAEIERADLLRERGYFPVVKKLYTEQLSNLKLLSTEEQLRLYAGLAATCQILEEYPDAMKTLEAEKKLLQAKTQPWRDLVATQATILDLTDKHEQASALYKEALEGKDEFYSVLEPLRRASDRAAEKKDYAMGDYLYRRQIELLNKAPNPVGVTNAYLQLARMYRWGKKADKSRLAYEQAIAYCKSHASEQSSLSIAQQELSQLEKESH